MTAIETHTVTPLAQARQLRAAAFADLLGLLVEWPRPAGWVRAYEVVLSNWRAAGALCVVLGGVER
jgi:hypothetical protein